MPQHHEVPSTPATVHWGYFESTLAPVLEVDSGDTVTLNCLTGEPAMLPEGDFTILPDMLRVYEESERPMPGHILTGPVAVRGAKPGDVLEVRIKDVQLRQDWGYTRFRPLGGTLPEDFEHTHVVHTRLDAEAMMGRLPWGLEIPLSPFFGVMGVAPPPAWGRIISLIPRAHGGNLDLKELGAGSTLYLPVFNDGALFSAGDGHGRQGDGEVCSSAIETALKGTFELHLRKDMALSFPRAETPTHYITMGINEDLDDAAKEALRNMIGLISEKANISRDDAYILSSLAVDMRITQLVNQHKGVHAVLAKLVLHGE